MIVRKIVFSLLVASSCIAVSPSLEAKESKKLKREYSLKQLATKQLLLSAVIIATPLIFNFLELKLINGPQGAKAFYWNIKYRGLYYAFSSPTLFRDLFKFFTKITLDFIRTGTKIYATHKQIRLLKAWAKRCLEKLAQRYPQLELNKEKKKRIASILTWAGTIASLNIVRSIESRIYNKIYNKPVWR